MHSVPTQSHLRRCALASALALLGCSQIPRYERPAAPVAETYAIASDSATPGQARSGAEVPWQNFFQDRRLQRLIAVALQNNRDLRMAVLAIEQTRAQVGLRQADLAPGVNVGITGSRGPSTSGAISATYSAGLSVTAYELDFFGRLRALSEVAQAHLLASEAARATVQISLIASVANTYLATLADDALLRLAQATVAAREETLRLTQLKAEHGSTSLLELSQAQSLAAAARVTLAQSQRQRAQNANALVLLLGQALPSDLPDGLPLNAQGLVSDLPAGLPSGLLTRRPDVRQAEQQLVANHAQVGAARAAFFPRISLTASAGVVSAELDALFTKGSSAWMFAPQLVLPLLDFGRNQANLAAAQAGRDIAVAQYEKTIQTSFREVSDALVARATLAEQLRAQDALHAAEQTRARLTELRFTAGTASALEALDAQRSLLAAQQAAIQVQLQQLQSLVTLYKVLGGGW